MSPGSDTTDGSVVRKVLHAAVKRVPGALVGRLDRIRGLDDVWGGPFNGQEARRLLMEDLLARASIGTVVETGCCRGDTTAWFSQRPGLRVMTVDTSRRYVSYTKIRVRQHPGTTVTLSDSRTFLHRLASTGPIARDAPILFYLDAHWNDDLPLADELSIIARSWDRWIAVADDFKVPDDDGYEYDTYGLGRTLDMAYLRAAELHGLPAYFPSRPSSEESGAKRGSVVLVPEAMRSIIEGSPWLRTVPGMETT